jgi:DNA polymerase I-like protein with 3'-5' exonuclease and polymerase domains
MSATYRQLDLGPSVEPPGGSIQSAPLLEMAEIAKCSGHKVVFDCETTGLHWWRDRVIGVAFWCPDMGVGGYIPCADASDVAAIRSIMLDWSPDTTVINHNIKFDFHFMGIDPLAAPWQYFDTLIMAHLFDSRGAPQPSGRWDNPINERGSLSLERLALVWLRDSAKADYKDLVKRNDYGKHHHWPLRLLSRYATDDARLTYELCHYLAPTLARRGQIDLLKTAMRYLGIIWRVERRGLKLDRDHLNGVMAHVGAYISQQEKELWAVPEINEPFEWRSSSKLSYYLYDRYGWTKPTPGEWQGIKVTKAATSAQVLYTVAKHPLAPRIIQMRAADKLKGYIKGWLELADGNDVLHASYNLTQTVTGRQSSSDPNMQQIPGTKHALAAAEAFETTEALEAFYAVLNMRRSFVPQNDGWAMVGGDYSQQEVRLFGLLAGDQTLLAAVEAEDVHAAMAEQVWGSAEKPYRSWAKVLTLGMLYGMGLEKMRGQIGERADDVLASYHARYPGIRRYRREVEAEIEAAGYVTYWSGRRYYKSDSRGYHKAVNALCQGGAADLLMHGVVELHDWIEREGLPIKIANFVHDEVDFEIDQKALSEIAPMLIEKMQVPHLLGTPFAVDLKAGPTLGDLRKI